MKSRFIAFVPFFLILSFFLYSQSTGKVAFETGMKLYRSGNYEEAIRNLRVAVQERDDPETVASAHLALGVLLMTTKKEDQAKLEFARAFIVNPNLELDRDIYSPKTIALFEQAKQDGLTRIKNGMNAYYEGNFAKANEDLDTGANLLRLTSPKIDRVLVVNAYLTLARINQSAKKNDAALQEFQNALEVDPELQLDPKEFSPSTIALFLQAKNLGKDVVREAESLLVKNEVQPAIEILEKNRNVLQAKQTRASADFYLAKAYYITENKERASDVIDALLREDPGFAPGEKEKSGSFNQYFEQRKSTLKPTRILIVKGKQNKVHDLAIEGFKSELTADYRITGTDDLKANIARHNPNVIFAVGTDSLTALKNSKTALPVVFVNVPKVETGGLKSNMGGVYMDIPAEAQFSFLLSVLPKIKKIGVIYDKGTNQSFVDAAAKAAAEYGLQISKASVDSAEEVPTALRRMDDFDVFWTVPDPAVSSADSFAEIIRSNARKNVPTFAPHESLVKELGAMFSLSPNFRSMGVQAAKLTKTLLALPAGTRVPVQFPERSISAINLKVAQKLNSSINPESLTTANIVYR